MTIPPWPSCLPLPMLDGYAYEIGDANNERGGGEFGPATSRNRSDRQTAKMSARFTMTELQLAIFEAWWKHEIANGAAWFTMPMNMESLYGHGYNNDELCRFSGGYAASIIAAGIWSVTAEVAIDEPVRA